MKVEVRKAGRTWGVFINDELYEGGFFSRQAAETCANERSKELQAQDPERWDGQS